MIPLKLFKTGESVERCFKTETDHGWIQASISTWVYHQFNQKFS